MIDIGRDIEFNDGLAGAQIGLIDFETDEEVRVGAVLAAAGALLRTVQTATAADPSPLRGCDALLLNANRFRPDAIELACRSHAPILAVGGLCALRRAAAGGYTWANDYLVEPWTPHELLLRLVRVIQLASSTPYTAQTRYEPLVLIADDDEDLTALLSAVLRDHHVSCFSAHDGPTALRRCRELLPDLLLLDVDMPLLNGFRVLEIIRSDPSLQGLCVLMLTGSSSPAHVMRGADLSIRDYLVKPASPTMIWRRIKNLLQPAHAWPERDDASYQSGRLRTG